MIRDDIQQGNKIFLIKTNTTIDPMQCYQKMTPYNPVIVFEMDIASSIYEFETVNRNTLPCFDVFGDHGTENKGQTDGTRRVFLMDVGMDNSDDDFLFSFASPDEAKDKVNELLSKDNINKTMETALDDWHIKPSDENRDVFIKLLNL